MSSHGHHLGHNGLVRPVDTKDLSKLLKVLGGSLANREDSVSEPAHAQAAELLIEELHTELAGKKRHVFDDSKADTPLLVFCQLDDSGEEGLGEKLDANDYKWKSC